MTICQIVVYKTGGSDDRFEHAEETGKRGTGPADGRDDPGAAAVCRAVRSDRHRLFP